jgi:hypothetical protein
MTWAGAKTGQVAAGIKFSLERPVVATRFSVSEPKHDAGPERMRANLSGVNRFWVTSSAGRVFIADFASLPAVNMLRRMSAGVCFLRCLLAMKKDDDSLYTNFQPCRFRSKFLPAL